VKVCLHMLNMMAELKRPHSPPGCLEAIESSSSIDYS